MRDFELWVVLAITLAILFPILVAFGGGAALLRHPEWDYAFRSLAETVIQDRAPDAGDLTSADISIADDILGSRVKRQH